MAFPLALLLLVAFSLLQVFHGYSHEGQGAHAWGTDDAYISYRYAENLAAGDGLVFNPSRPGVPEERVEGFSNLLYVLLLTPLIALVGRDGIYFASAGINLLFAVACLLLLYRFTRSRLGEQSAGRLAFLVALCPPLWVAVASGLETPLVLLLQMALWVLLERALEEPERRRTDLWLCAVAALSVLTRIDGFLVPLLAALYLALRGRGRAARNLTLTTLGIFAALTAFRLAYYGWPLPNTYYVKVDGLLGARIENGWLQLATSALATGLVFYLVTLLVTAIRGAMAIRRGSDPLRSIPFPVVFAAAWIGYFLYIGGDIYNERFFLFLYPLGAFVLAQLLEEAPHPGLATLLLLLVLGTQLVPLRTDRRFEYRCHKYDFWVGLGRDLGARYPGAYLAADAVGKVPFFSGLRTLDMLGLNDEHIAHRPTDRRAYFRVGHTKSDFRYVVSRRPDLIATWVGDEDPLIAPPFREAAMPTARQLAWAGFRLAYLVNTKAESRGMNIVDVRTFGDDAVERLRRDNFYYAVYERIPGTAPTVRHLSTRP